MLRLAIGRLGRISALGKNRMQLGRMLDTLGNVATILTAVIAACFWGQYQWERRQRRLRLENHLRDYTQPSDGRGCTLPELVADLGMSEHDILDAAFRSRVIERRRRTEGASGRTVAVELTYAHPEPTRF